MALTLTVLVVEADDTFVELYTRILSVGLPTAQVLRARTGRQAVDHVRNAQIDLVILDGALSGTMTGREVCLKVRSILPHVPILPCSADAVAGPFFSDLGCAPLVTKQALAAEPLRLIEYSTAALAYPTVMRVPASAFSYMLERADAALADELREAQPGVMIVSAHAFLRGAFRTLLASMEVRVSSAVEEVEGLPEHGVLARTTLIVGPVTELYALQQAGRVTHQPVLGIALRVHELDEVAAGQLGESSVLLYDERGDPAQLITTLTAVAQGQRMIAVPATTLVRWVPPLDRLSSRLWEALVASFLAERKADVASQLGVTEETVEKYWRRIREQLGVASLPEALERARAHLATHLGTTPVPLTSLRGK